MQSTVETYVAAWNAANSAERERLLRAAVADGVTYLDPHVPAPVEGLPALLAHIGRFRSLFAHALEPLGPADAHHGAFRLAWRLRQPDGHQLSTGLIVGAADAAGRLTWVAHFVDRAPAT